MKVKGSKLVKQIMSMMSSVTRSKTDAIKTQFMVTAFTLLSKRPKKLSMAAISAKINHVIDGIFNINQSQVQNDQDKAIVLYENKAGPTTISYVVEEFDDDDDKYPDLRHSLFDEEEEMELAQLLDDPSSSISAIDIVKNSKENGHKFNLEDEIDQVADLFITKFHKRMRLQKLLSFKRNQQMLETNALPGDSRAL